MMREQDHLLRQHQDFDEIDDDNPDDSQSVNSVQGFEEQKQDEGGD